VLKAVKGLLDLGLTLLSGVERRYSECPRAAREGEGLVFDALRRAPRKGESAVAGGTTAVVDVSGSRITRVRVCEPPGVAA